MCYTAARARQNQGRPRPRTMSGIEVVLLGFHSSAIKGWVLNERKFWDIIINFRVLDFELEIYVVRRSGAWFDLNRIGFW